MHNVAEYVPSSWSRLLARILDGVIVFIFMGPALRASGPDADGWGLHFSWPLAIYIMLVAPLYEGFAVWLTGTTFGKWALGLRVVPAHSAKPIEFIHAFLRGVTFQFSAFFGLAIPALAWFREDRTHLADWVAETKVISLRPRHFKPKKRLALGTVCVLFFGIFGLSMATLKLSHVSFDASGVNFSLRNPDE